MGVMAFDTTQVTHPENRSRPEPGKPCHALSASAHPGGFNGQDAYTGHLIPSAGIPRRLMPIECERLQGWPDDWTRYGRREDGTVYALSDSARYRLCGNGIGAPVTHWIGLRAMALLTALKEAA